MILQYYFDGIPPGIHTAYIELYSPNGAGTVRSGSILVDSGIFVNLNDDTDFSV